MRFALTDEQAGFAGSLRDLMSDADSVKVARSWAAGDTRPGLDLWARLAEQGVHALVVPEEAGGLGGTPVDLVVAFEVLGEQLAVGPWVESAAFLPAFLGGCTPGDDLASGAVGTVAFAPVTPYALDADVADHAFTVVDGRLYDASVGAAHSSVDATRRLLETSAGLPVETCGDLGRAGDLAALACAAELLGCGERLLADTVAYAKQRKQFGRAIGSYQAIKHRLADSRIALDFARPLVHGAALGHGSAEGSRDASAAKVAASDAAYLASRAALQVHGAVGYTAELDLGLWITRVRALVGAWGTPSYHRGRVLAALVEEG
jgi:alkylation response protein AidB-like acyl-CoA dehydrogenase